MQAKTKITKARILLWVAITLNAVLGISLVMAWLGKFIAPNDSLLCYVANLGTVKLLFIAIAAAIFWSLRKRYLAGLANILLVALQWPLPLAYVQMHPDENATPTARTLVTANLNEFVYKRAPEIPQLARYIKNLHADIVCLQEYYPMPTKDSVGRNVQLTQLLQNSGGFTSAAFTELTTGYGLLTLSKIPIVAFTRLPSKDNSASNGIQKLWLDMGGDTIVIYNVHLQSFGTTTRLAKQDSATAHAKNYTLVQTTVAAQMQQMEAILKDIETETYPVLLAGDLNNIPYSYIHKKLTEHLQDAYLVAGNGMSSTFGPTPLMLRLDYVLADAHFHFLAHHILPNSLSDHKAVWVRYDLKHALK